MKRPQRLLVLVVLVLAAGLTAYLLLSGEPAPTQHIIPPGQAPDAPPPRAADAVPPPASMPDAVAAAPAGTPGTADAAATSDAGHEPYGGAAAHAALEVRQDAKIARGLVANPDGGVRVDDTPAGSVAEELRLLPGDVITSVNGEAVSTPEDFVRIYRAEGRPTQMTVLREGRELHRH